MGHKCGNIKCDICSFLSEHWIWKYYDRKKIYKFQVRLQQHKRNLSGDLQNMQKAVCWVQCQKIVCDLSKNKSNITLYIEGQRGFKHEKMNWTFFLHKSQCNHCDRNDQETPEDFWTYPLETMFSKGLN